MHIESMSPWSFTGISVRKITLCFATGAVLLSVTTGAYAQGGSPIPGGWNGASAPADQASSAPIPGADSVQAGAPSHNFSSGVPAATSKYAQLPLSIFDAKSRMTELRTMAGSSRAQDVLEAVNRLSEWLGDMCDAHNKMASVFGKHEQTKNQALAERQAVSRFSSVRNQAQLLKAELLMQQHRYPEALTPLVDIVIAEPTSATGLAAYGKLKELGFVEDASPVAETTSTVQTSTTVETLKRIQPGKPPSTASNASAAAAANRRVH